MQTRRDQKLLVAFNLLLQPRAAERHSLVHNAVINRLLREAGYRERYSRRPQSQRRLCRHHCITTLSPNVTRNELGALPSQTSHRLKQSSPILHVLGMWPVSFDCPYIFDHCDNSVKAEKYDSSHSELNIDNLKFTQENESNSSNRTIFVIIPILRYAAFTITVGYWRFLKFPDAFYFSIKQTY